MITRVIASRSETLMPQRERPEGLRILWADVQESLAGAASPLHLSCAGVLGFLPLL